MATNLNRIILCMCMQLNKAFWVFETSTTVPNAYAELYIFIYYINMYNIIQIEI